MIVEKIVYIGDGVYAEYDGFGIILTANNPTTDTIYIEPQVFDNLVKLVENIKNFELE